MKICIYEARKDELKDFDEISKELGLELKIRQRPEYSDPDCFIT